MSRAVLIMDMPESCSACPLLLKVTQKDLGLCLVTPPKDDNEPMPTNRSDWCPLRPIPEKIMEPIDSDDVGKDYSAGTMDGWNACIDAIGGDDK